MNIYEAISEMRHLSRTGQAFSFSFMSYDRSRDKCNGIVVVNNALLRKRGQEKYNQNAQLQEEYLDLDTNEPRRFWHCCLMTFNGKKLKIS